MVLLPRNSSGVVCLALLGLAAAALRPMVSVGPQVTVLNVDVCIIGGGAAGTYAAIKNRDLGKRVVVIEKQDRLGGHTNTYIDPTTGQPIELGVAEYEDTEPVRDFFKRFDIPLYKYNFSIPGVTSVQADFKTGLPAQPEQGDLEAAWEAFQAQVEKYPTLDYDLSDVPFPVPPDLLLPFGEFLRKYQLEDAVPYLSLYGQGWGNFTTVPTLLAIKYFPPYFFSPASIYGAGDGALAAKDNSLLYDKAAEELGGNLLLNSTVVEMDRSGPDYVFVAVQTPNSRRIIRARKIISAIPPLLNNLKGFDLNDAESPIFDKFKGHSWYVGLVKNSGIPSNTSLINYGTDNDANFNIPELPGFYEFFATRVPDLHYFLYGGNDTQPSFTQAEIKQSMEDTLTRLREGGVIPQIPSPQQELEIIDFANHSPYEVYVSAEEIEKGFYNRLFGLQGERKTYWTGAAWVTHSSAAIWNFTDGLVERMWADDDGPAEVPVDTE
ncbi:MAG: hypothetical protein Q9183_005609 [Haloplaca sp. 2 TL-2023]